ncbi:Mitochondrial inner membrane protease subunit 2-like protein [Drosera capensis]
MSTRNLIWDFTKKCFTFSIIALTISDRYASIKPVRGRSMSPTLNPVADEGDSFLGFTGDDYVLVEKFCLRKYLFSHGDVIVFSSPLNHKEKNIKRIIGLPGDWLRLSSSHDTEDSSWFSSWKGYPHLMASSKNRPIEEGSSARQTFFLLIVRSGMVLSEFYGEAPPFRSILGFQVLIKPT